MRRTSTVTRPCRLFLACGAAAALLAPVALAQPQTQAGDGADRNRQNQPAQQRGTTQPARTDSRGASQATQPSILRDLAGVWQVECRVNPGAWRGRQNWNTQDRDTQNQDRNQNQNQEGLNRDPSNAGEDPVRSDQDRLQRMGQNVPADQTTFRGVAEISIIMGGSIMQERLHIMEGDTPNRTNPIPATNPDRDAANQNNTDRNRAPVPGDANRIPGFNQNPEGFSRDDQQSAREFDRNQFRQDWAQSASRWTPESTLAELLSFVSFDHQTQTYNAVFMNSMDGSMHQCSGTYDASSQRIVLEGIKPHGQAGASRTDPAGDQDRMGNQPANRPSGQGNMASRAWSHDNVRVEIELFGTDMIRVTMYDSMDRDRNADRWDNQPGTPDSQRNNTDGNTGTASSTGNMDNPANRNNPNQPASANQPNRPATAQPGQSDRPGSTNTYPIAGAAPTTIVYQATYTRATGAEASRIHSLLNGSVASIDTDR